MALIRKQFGETQNYKGHEIVIRHFGSDFLCEVDGSELSPFYLSADGASKAGMRHVDLLESDKK